MYIKLSISFKISFTAVLLIFTGMFRFRVEHPRVVLRKGHIGVSFYFIFSGSVFVNVEELLVKTGHVMWHTAVTLQRGDSFGVSNPLAGRQTVGSANNRIK